MTNQTCITAILQPSENSEDCLTIQASISSQGLKFSIVKDESIQEVYLDEAQTESLRQLFYLYQLSEDQLMLANLRK
jgi:hypothetical protein